MTRHFGAYHIEALQPGRPADLRGMTFPAYRHLLAQRPTMRLPSEPEQRPIQPVALAARTSEHPVALAVAELPARREDGASELLSVFVAPEHRGQGIGTALVEAMEEALGARGRRVGRSRLHDRQAVHCGRRADLREARMGGSGAAHHHGAVHHGGGARDALVWPDGPAARRRRDLFLDATSPMPSAGICGQSNERAPWIANSLQPWRHDALGFDPVSSVGLRYRGEVVGWVINHQIDPRTVRFTCSFMRKDLSRRARIVAALFGSHSAVVGSRVRGLHAGHAHGVSGHDRVHPPALRAVRELHRRDSRHTQVAGARVNRIRPMRSCDRARRARDPARRCKDRRGEP